MIHKKIRAILLILTAALILFAFAACNSGPAANDNPSNTQGDGGTPTDTGGDDVTADELSEFTPANINYDGFEFRFLNFVSMGSDWKALQYSEIVGDRFTYGDDIINDAVFDRNAKVEEMYGITIKEVLHGAQNDDYGATVDKTMMLIKAGEDEFDAALFTGNGLPKLFAVPNAAHNLLQIPEFDLTKSWWNQGAANEFTLGSKLYTATGDISIWSSLSTVVFYFNKQLLEECQLENPYNLVREGKWTWDKMAEMAKGATRDTSGDGKIDRFDQIGIASESGTMYEAILCAGERFTYKDSDGMPLLNQNLEKISNIIDKVMPILRNADYTYATSDLYGKFKENPYFVYTMPKFRDNEILFYTQQLMVALDLRDMNADFGVLPFPKYDEKQSDYWSDATGYFLKYVWIPTTNTEPGRTANILQAMAYYSQQDVTPALYNVTITNKALRDTDSLEMLELINRNIVYDISTIYNWGDVFSIYGTIYDKKSNNLAAQYEKNLDKIVTAMQATIDELSN